MRRTKTNKRSTDIVTLPRQKERTREDVIKDAISNPFLVTRELCDRSLFHFMKTFWSCVSSDEFKPNWHIEYLCRELEKVAERVSQNLPKAYDLIINVPPGTTKTITASIMWPVWCWTKWPHLRFICASYSGALSLESAEYSRDLVRHDFFKMIYPELDIKEDKDTKSNFKVVKKEYITPGRAPHIKQGGNRYSTSVGGTLTGFHGHILIVDDPLNPEEAASEKELENANRWMEQTLPTRKTDKAVTPTVLIMQRLHQSDPTGHWLEKAKQNVRHISLPGEIRNFEKYLEPADLKNRYTDGLLDPVRMPWDVLKDLEADLGQYGYAGQIGQNPTPVGGGMFHVDHIQRISALPAAPMIMRTVRYWDKAGSADEGAYTVGVKMHYTKAGYWVIEDVKRGRWSTDTREKIIRQTAEADGNNTIIGIEQEPGSGGKESAEATIKNLAGFSCYADKPTGDKVFRADPYSVQMNYGMLQIVNADWNLSFIEEHRYFPVGTYKDQVDAAAGAFNYLTQKKIARRIT